MFLLLLLLYPLLPLLGVVQSKSSDKTRVNLQLDVTKLSQNELARHLYRLQYYLSEQHTRWEHGRLQLMLTIIERHRAVPSQREPLKALQQKLRTHSREMRTLVRTLLSADLGDESEVPADAPDLALFQVEQDWELYSYMTKEERTEFHRLLRRYRAIDQWNGDKRARLDETLGVVRKLEAMRLLMRRFENDCNAMTSVSVTAALHRIELLSGNKDLLLSLAPYKKTRDAAALAEIRRQWLEERAGMKARY